MNATVFLTDGYGGIGGIAQYNRDFLLALSRAPKIGWVTAIPRVVHRTVEPAAPRVLFLAPAANSNARYFAEITRLAMTRRPCDVVFCMHLNLLPVAWLWARRSGAPVVLFMYGLEAKRAPRPFVYGFFLSRTDAIVTIREETKRKLASWARVDAVPSYRLENPIHLDRYGPGPKPSHLVERYGLGGRLVIMTTGRVVDEGERRKGFDEVIEVLPSLAKRIPNVTYVVVGDGNAVPRLREKARTLGVGARVVFTGYIEESEKAEYLRLADVFAMPGSGPTFDRYPLRFSFVEAMACGIPVVGCIPEPDGDSEMHGSLLTAQVDPNDPRDIERGIMQALEAPRGVVPEGLRRYSFESFCDRLYAILRSVVKN